MSRSHQMNPNELREEAARLIGEDRLPLSTLKEIVDEFSTDAQNFTLTLQVHVCADSIADIDDEAFAGAVADLDIDGVDIGAVIGSVAQGWPAAPAAVAVLSDSERDAVNHYIGLAPQNPTVFYGERSDSGEIEVLLVGTDFLWALVIAPNASNPSGTSFEVHTSNAKITPFSTGIESSDG